MKRESAGATWGRLCLIEATAAGLMVADGALPGSFGWHRASECVLLLLGIGTVMLWVRANASALVDRPWVANPDRNATARLCAAGGARDQRPIEPVLWFDSVAEVSGWDQPPSAEILSDDRVAAEREG